MVVTIWIARSSKETESPPWLKAQSEMLQKYWDRNNELRAEEVKQLTSIASSLHTISTGRTGF